MSWTLGINTPPLGWHDPSAALVDPEGKVVALVEEERLSRKKHGLNRYPIQAARECIRIAGISPHEIGVVAVGWDFPRHWPRRDRGELNPGLPGRLWEFDDWKTFVDECLELGYQQRQPDLIFVPHHVAHAYCAFYASAWESAAVLVIDGNGDDESASIFVANRDRRIRRLDRIPVTHSLGYMYDAMCSHIGFSFLEAGKAMGLAAYGREQPVRLPIFTHTQEGFSPPFSLPTNSEYDVIVGAWRSYFEQNGFPKITVDPERLHVSEDAVGLAWSAQAGLEEVVINLASKARLMTGETNLCLAGGVALNCSANGLIQEPVFIPPVPHDAGIALGAAWYAVPPKANALLSPYLGTDISASETEYEIRKVSYPKEVFDPKKAACLIAGGKIGGIVFGRAEAGPRALGHRSIIASPRSVRIRDQVNERKSREKWRPLSPVSLEGFSNRYWEQSIHLHRYMIGASRVTEDCRRHAPAVVHVDGTARPFVISDKSEPLHALLSELEAIGHPPILINTSLNNRGEPIVNCVSDALKCAKSVGLDFLIIGDYLVKLKSC